MARLFTLFKFTDKAYANSRGSGKLFLCKSSTDFEVLDPATGQATGQQVTLVNLHLEYGASYRETIPELQEQQIAANIPAIMGGDTNNVQGENLVTMITDWHAATNIQPNGNGGLTSQHENQQTPDDRPVQKAYDGFFVSPGLLSAHIEETGGMRFKNAILKEN